jgi:hypothetical protein
MDAKQACDKLNGFNFQNRYLVGMTTPSALTPRHNNLADIRYESADETSQYYITSQRRWQDQKRTSPNASRI